MISTTHQTRKASFLGLAIHYQNGQKPPTDLEITKAIINKWGLNENLKIKGTHVRAIRQGWGDNIVMSFSAAAGCWQIDEVYMTPKRK